MKLMDDITNDFLVIHDDKGKEMEWNNIYVSMKDLHSVMQREGSMLCMDSEDDRKQFLALVLDRAKLGDTEEDYDLDIEKVDEEIKEADTEE